MHGTTYQEQLNDHLQNVSLTNKTNLSKLALTTLCPTFFHCNPYSADCNCVQTRVESTRQCICRSLSTKSTTMQTIISIFRNSREKIIMRNRLWNLHVVEWNLFQNSDTLIPISYIAQYHHCSCRSPPSFKSSDRFGMLSTGLLAAGTDTRGRLLRRNMIRWQTTELMYFLFIKYVCESWFDKLAVIKTKTTPDA